MVSCFNPYFQKEWVFAFYFRLSKGLIKQKALRWVSMATYRLVLRPVHTRELAPAARSCNKLPRLHQRFLTKKYVAQQNFCSRVLLPHIKLVWYEGASSRGKSVARVCFRSKLPRVYWNLLAMAWCVSSWPIILAYFFITTSSHAPIGLFHHSAPSSCPSCVLVGVLTRERVAGVCCGSKLPRVYRPLDSFFSVLGS